MASHILSKSTFMTGVQCKKRLYLHKNCKRLGIERDVLTAQQEAIFAAGTDAGLLAQQLFPGGVDCSPEFHYDYGPSAARTVDLIANGQSVIYEASFIYEGVLAALDILVKRKDGWHAYEMKSTKDVKPQHIQDAALQYWVITHCGVTLKSMNVLHFNGEYIRGKELDVQQLFTWDDVTEQVLELQPWVSAEVAANKTCLQQSEAPDVAIGPHCTSPYACDFRDHCFKHVPKYSVLNLTRAGKKGWELFNRGIVRIEDVPDDVSLTAAQQLQIDAERSGRSFIDVASIAEFLRDLRYPLYFLDYETIMPGVPLFEGTKPNQQVVFQYSVHKMESKEAKPTHMELLADHSDPHFLKDLVVELIKDCGTKGNVLVFNKSFEKPRTEELMRMFPEHAGALQSIIDRMVDLAVPFQSKWYYTPDMMGSYSIKKVLPALTDIDYKDLDIQEGGTASSTFMQMVQGTFSGDIASKRTALIKYCERDTWAMVKVLEKLYEVVEIETES
jgi:hypothetical protein